MLDAILAGGVTADSVGVLERMTALYERVEARNAEKEFNAAFVAMQNEIPVIVATSIIPNRGKYERYEDVMRVVSPILARHGFSVSFAMGYADNRITQTCHLRHITGHSQSNTFAVRLGGKADSETQADCKAATTAKRNALLNALNIIIRQDIWQDEDGRDATILGGVIDQEKIHYLREQVRETGSNEARFLELAGAKTYEEITASAYPMLVRSLSMKARAR
jgi:hypothetical protein